VGAFVVATGIAGLVASPVWGKLADRSSRLVMAAASGASALVIAVYLVARGAGLDSTAWLGPATYLLLAIAHAGARMGRKTYVVDMAKGDQRTRYVAVSNTIIGVVLLLTGLIGAVVAGYGPTWTLAGLALAGVAGTAVSLSMKEVESRAR
jgi:MFS family permease